jgi:DNA modification methylase
MCEITCGGLWGPPFREMEVNRIYNESNIETMARMPEGFIDLTVTSPPYDDLRVYKGYDFDVDSTARGLFRATKDGGVVVWVVCDKTVNGDKTGTSFRHALKFKEVGFKLWDTEIYAKNNPIPGDCGKRHRNVYEFMFVFVKGKEPNTFNPIEVFAKNPGKAFEQFRLERDGRNYYRGASPIVTGEMRKAANIFYYNVGVNGDDMGAYKHPAVFPEALAHDRIFCWSNPGDLVYDPFMGSGTTAKAAHQLGRRWIGSEISSEYVELANKRLAPYLAQDSLFA